MKGKLDRHHLLNPNFPFGLNVGSFKWVLIYSPIMILIVIRPQNRAVTLCLLDDYQKSYCFVY